MARKNEKPVEEGTTTSPNGSPEEGACGADAGIAGAGEGAAGAPGAGSSDSGENMQPLIDGLRAENDGLRKEIEALKRERDAAARAARTAAETQREQQRERHDGALLRVLRRASEKAQKSGDAPTHAVLEHVLVTLAEARHRVKEGVKFAKGDGLRLLEDLEDLLD